MAQRVEGLLGGDRCLFQAEVRGQDGHYNRAILQICWLDAANKPIRVWNVDRPVAGDRPTKLAEITTAAENAAGADVYLLNLIGTGTLRVDQVSLCR